MAVAAATRRSDALALGSFVVLGLPDGMLGTAWPSMRVTFGAPVSSLGLILLLATAGSVLVTAFVGRLIRRLGVPALLAVAGLCAAVGFAGFALALSLGLVLGLSVLTGAAAGLMDGGLNTAVALSGRARLLNLLHGAYGVGTAIGPLVVTAAILAGSWRLAYLVLTVLDLVIASCWLRHRQRSGPVRAAAGEAPASPPLSVAQWSRRRYGSVVATGMGVFFIYTGLEVGAGQWEASFARGHLGLSASQAGLATFGYWGALTAVRIVLALLPRPVAPRTVVSVGSVLAVAAAAVIWWQPSSIVTVLAFAVLGGALAGVFPALISLTPLAHRGGAGPARHRLASRRGRGRRSRDLRSHRPAHRRGRLRRLRPLADRPRGAAGGQRADLDQARAHRGLTLIGSAPSGDVRRRWPQLELADAVALVGRRRG